MRKERDLLTFEILERTAECVKYIFYFEGCLQAGVVVFIQMGEEKF